MEESLKLFGVEFAEAREEDEYLFFLIFEVECFYWGCAEFDRLVWMG